MDNKKYIVHCATCGNITSTDDEAEASRLAEKHRFSLRGHVVWLKSAERIGIIQIQP